MMGWEKDGSGLDVKRVRGKTLPQWCTGYGGWYVGHTRRGLIILGGTDVAKLHWKDRRVVRREARRGLAT